MALPDIDLQKIRGVVDEAIAVHPRFDQLKHETIYELSEVYNDGLELINNRFDLVAVRLENVEGRLVRVEGRLGKVVNRIDNMRIVSEA